MKLPSAILSLVFAASSAALAGPRIAVVRVADVYKGLTQTKLEQDRVAADFEALTKDRRLTELGKLLETLKQQSATLPQPKDENDTASLAKIRAYSMKYEEAKTLRQDYETFHDDEAKKINGRKVKEMRAALDRIVEAARKIGKDEGFDWVLDSSGNTNTTMPVLVYSKAPVDITDKVLSVLQPAAAPAETGGAAPTAPNH